MDGYTERITLQSEKAIVRVYSPILSEQEKAARLKLIYAAAADLMKKERRYEQA